MNYCVLIISVFFICFICSTSASIGFGQCKMDYYEKDNIYHLNKAMGEWYENATKSKWFPNLHGECARVELFRFTHDPNNVHRFVKYHINRKQNKRHAYFGTVQRNKGDNGLYAYAVNFTKQQNRVLPQDLVVPFKLIDTDYNCWAVVYTCYYLANIYLHFDDITVLTKTRTTDCLNTRTNHEVGKVLRKVNAKLDKFKPIDHDGCKTNYPNHY